MEVCMQVDVFIIVVAEYFTKLCWRLRRNILFQKVIKYIFKVFLLWKEESSYIRIN